MPFKPLEVFPLVIICDLSGQYLMINFRITVVTARFYISDEGVSETIKCGDNQFASAVIRPTNY